MEILGESEIKELKKFFEEVKEKVSFDIYLDNEKNPETSEILVNLFKQLKENFGDKFDYEIKENIDELNLDFNELDAKGPIITPSNKKNIIFLGLPSGHEFSVLLEDIHNLSNNHSHLPMDMKEKIKNIDKEIEILVFVTPTCPYCPPMTSLAHNMAFLNEKIKGIMVEAIEFPNFSDKFNVSGVPRTIVRDLKTKEIIMDQEGAIPFNLFIENLIRKI